MKNIAKILSTAAVVLLASCQAEIKPAEEAISGAKHTVKISSVMTKTELNDDGQSVSWTKDDEDRIHVFENGVEAAASDLAATAAVDGSVMSILADFYGTAPYTYTAILSGYFADNKATIPDEQEAYSTTFDGIADILVAEPVNSAAQIENFTFNYKRVVAVNKMTLKGLAASETINSITITSDKDILGSYNMTSDSWEMSGKTLLLENLGEAVTDAEGNCVVYYVTAPVEGATISIRVVTDNHIYGKTFSKSISFAQGSVTRFNVNLSGCLIPFFYESFDSNEGTGGNDGSWSGNIATNNTQTDNPNWAFVRANGANQCIKLGAGSALGSATTPSLNYSGDATMTFKAAAWNGNSESTTLKLSVVDGGSVSPATVTLVKGEWTEYTVDLSDLTSNSKIKFEGNAASNSRFFLDEVSVTESIVTKYSVNCSAVVNGSISADLLTAKAGATVNLTATPNDGYIFGSWNVTNVATSEAITVINNQFTMPAANVNVSATFVAIPDKTIAEFIAAEGGTCYLTGTVSNIANATYGNFDLTDNSGTIYVYGCLTPGGQKGQFSTLGIAPGDRIKVLASEYELYEGTKEEAKNVVFVEIVARATKYNVSIADGIANGTVSVDLSQAAAGQTVTITATPASGYRVKSVSAVKTASGDALTVTANKFTMPAEAVTVSAEFEITGSETTITWVAKDDSDNPGNANDWLSGTIDSNISWSATKGGNNNPKYYDVGNGLRVYSGGTFTVSAANGKKITKIVLTFSGTGYTFSTGNTNQTQTYNFDPSVSSKTWEVSRTCRLQKVQVTYE